MKYSMICMDIDGTLLDDFQQIPDNVRTSLKKAHDMGIKLALVSMRSPMGIDMIERQLGIPCIKAAYAGAYIYDGNGCIYSKTLSSEAAVKTCDAISEAGASLWIFEGEHWSVTEIDDWIKREISIVRHKPEIADINLLKPYWCEGQRLPHKFLAAGEYPVICRVNDELKRAEVDVQPGFSSRIYLEIMPLGIDKGFALEKLCGLHGVPKEETIAFGDQDTDIPLLTAAGLGIAMGNGIDNLKNYADLITRTNNEGGIAFALEHILNKA